MIKGGYHAHRQGRAGADNTDGKAESFVEPHRHGVVGEHAHRPLGEHAQEQECDKDRDESIHLGDAHTGNAEERDDSYQDSARPIAVHERTDIDHRQRCNQRAQHISAADLAVGKPEFGADIVIKNGDAKSLPRRRGDLYR